MLRRLWRAWVCVMDGYVLKVVHEGSTIPTETVRVARAADVLTIIPSLLASHPDCHRIGVYFQEVRLFAVDCTGSKIED